MAGIVVKRKRKRNISPARLIVAVLALLVLAAGLIYIITGINRQLPYEPISEAEIAAIRESTPKESAQREAVVEAGLTLLGKVNYFWGGKSSAIGWDENWGQPEKVSSTGSKSTGQIRPFGLDCSGFVSWCYIQIGLSPTEMEEKVGHGTWNQWDHSTSISWKELRVGDWVFQNKYPTNKGNHIGICIGFDKDSKPLFLHCASSFDNVVVTGADDIFLYARRPIFYDEAE